MALTRSHTAGMPGLYRFDIIMISLRDNYSPHNLRGLEPLITSASTTIIRVVSQPYTVDK